MGTEKISEHLSRLVDAATRGRPAPDPEVQRLLGAAMMLYNRRAVERWGQGVVPMPELPPDLSKAERKRMEAELARIPENGHLVITMALRPDPDDDAELNLRVQHVDLRLGPWVLDAVEEDPSHAALLALDPSSSEARVEDLLDPLHRTQARKALREHLEAMGSGLDRRLADRFALCFAVVEGIGRQGGALARLLGSGELSPPAEELVRSLLVVQAPDAIERVLGPDALLEAAVGWSVDQFELHTDSDVGGILDALEAQPSGSDRAQLVDVVETIRAQTRMPAASVWGPALNRPGLADLHDKLALLIAREGTDSARSWADQAQGVLPLPLATGVARAAARAPRPVPVSGARAWIGWPDGQSAFQVVVVFPRRRGELELAAVVCRACGTVRDGLGFPVDEAELDDALEPFQAVQELVPLPPGRAARLVEEARARADGPLELSPAARRALDLILPLADPSAPGPRPAPFGILERDLALIEPMCQSWFFDRADLRRVGVAPPQAGVDPPEWAARASQQLGDAANLARIRAMCALLAEWLYHAGDGELAARLAASGAALDAASFAEHPVVAAMLARTVSVLRAQVSDGLAWGDAGIRRQLAQHPRLRAKTPRNRNLGALDLAEVLVGAEWALAGQVAAFAAVPTARREEALIDVGVALSAALLAGAARDPEAVVGQLATALAAHVPEVDAVELGRACLEVGTRYLGEVCMGCPTVCWEHPDRRVRRGWRTGAHPALP